MVRAWKECLDPEGREAIGFVDFARATRQFGFNGPIKEIWQQLDADDSGVISFDELAPEAAKPTSGNHSNSRYYYYAEVKTQCREHWCNNSISGLAVALSDPLQFPDSL